MNIETLYTNVKDRFEKCLTHHSVFVNEITIEIKPEHLREVCFALREEPEFDFKMLIDVCGVDYLHYGLSEWETESATTRGFERGVDTSAINHPPTYKPRFASVYHLLSLKKNQRIRIRVLLDHVHPVVPSVYDIWPAANWFEREAFDLFGIIYDGHPDLRRILTDYGFMGHPFRKDFPLSGQVEVRYDANERRVVYEPVSIEPRILEPKVIRIDNRYQVEE